MPASPSPYLTPPPTLPPTRGGSAAPPNRKPLPLQPHLFHHHSHPVPVLHHQSQPQSVRIRLPPFTSVATVKSEDHEDEDEDGNARADKRRRVNKGSKSIDIAPSPQKEGTHNRSGESSRSPTEDQRGPLGPPPPRSGRPGQLPPIKPIGFAAAREARREDGGGLPSPVVMGFDFKAIDEDQLKTVRDTISIKEQQQALIAARRREAAQSQPSTPKELTFKGWTPKDAAENITGSSVVPPPLPPVSAGLGSGGGGVGRRREKTRDKVEKMSIVTSASDREVVPGSKSAPLNQGLASQQASPREPPSGSQTALPPHILPPLHGYSHHPNGLTDPRTAPLSHARGSRNGDEHEFARQQGPYYGLPQTRPLVRPYESQSSGNMRAPTSNERRNFSVPSTNLQPPSASPRYEVTSPRRLSGHLSNSPASPRVSREAFLAPFNQLYDLYAQTDSLRYSLQELLHRYEGAYQSQLNAMSEFKSTANAAGTLLGNLQASADSLKDMVRYEVERNSSAKDREMEEMRDRLRRLEEKLEKQA
ncbi:hypothetical protein IAT40_004684 [Kwoniella sp. CBS 6097]